MIVKPKSFTFFLRNTWSKPKNLLPRNYIKKKHKNYLNVPIFIQQSSCQRFLHPRFPYHVHAMQWKTATDKEHTVCSAYCQDSVCNGAHIQAAVSFLSGSYRKLCCHLVATCKTATYHLILKVKKLMEHEIVKQTERSASFLLLTNLYPQQEARTQSFRVKVTMRLPLVHSVVHLWDTASQNKSQLLE